MPFTAVLRPQLARPCSLLRVSHMFRVGYHELPKSRTTDGTTPISVAASFPDDFESSPSASQLEERKNKWDETLATLSEAAVRADQLEESKNKWDETLATLSEAAVRADQDDAKLRTKLRGKKAETPSMENREPELEEM